VTSCGQRSATGTSFVDGRQILIPILDFVFQHGHELDDWHHVAENLGKLFVNNVSLGIPSGSLDEESVGINAVDGRLFGMLALSDGEVEVELIDGNLHFPRVILFGARQESLREEEAADPKHDRLAVFHPMLKHVESFQEVGDV